MALLNKLQMMCFVEELKSNDKLFLSDFSSLTNHPMNKKIKKMKSQTIFNQPGFFFFLLPFVVKDQKN
jgi:hypothetical protein